MLICFYFKTLLTSTLFHRIDTNKGGAIENTAEPDVVWKVLVQDIDCI